MPNDHEHPEREVKVDWLPDDHPEPPQGGTPAGKEIWTALHQDLISLWCEWNLMRSLYLDEDNLALLKSTAPLFFGMTLAAFADRLFLGIARFCDPPQTKLGGKVLDNISLDALVKKEDPTETDKRWKPIRMDVDHFKTLAAGIIEHRKKRIAHTDAIVRLDVTTKSLRRLNWDDIEEAMTALASIMNATAEIFRDPPPEIAYELSGHAQPAERTGTEELLRFLRAGLEHQNAKYGRS